jgi:predicted RNase H-like HicB family nuclease
MTRYLAILSKTADSSYGVHFPDLPGCISAGDSEEEAMSNAGLALRLWAEDIDTLPQAKSAAELMANRHVRRDLADGAVLFMVHLIAARRKQRLNITMEPDILVATDEAAKAAGVSRSQFIETAVSKALGHRMVDLRS